MLAQRNTRYRPQLAQVKPGNDLVQPKVRKAFPDTAYWAASIHTDAQGHAHVRFTFPDSLTTWRATVRAITARSQGGSAINRVIVRKNVIVRMGTPRFLRKGDEITIPVIVHNYLDQAKQITVSLESKALTPSLARQSRSTSPARATAPRYGASKPLPSAPRTSLPKPLLMKSPTRSNSPFPSSLPA